jgi:sugar lactone lactonase YvrE
MTSKESLPTATASNTTSGRIFFLDIVGGRVVSVNPDCSDLNVIVDGRRGHPDGVVVDIANGHIYWTNMGKITPDNSSASLNDGFASLNDGSIERADLDGRNLTTIIPVGGTFTPKQLKIENESGKLYWSDREGMRVMRSNLDGSNIETLVETGHGDVDRLDPRNWCVGIAIDTHLGKIYWTQKGPPNAGKGRIFRANMEIPKGESAAHRTDIEVFLDNLPEPIDLELDLANRIIYWTDRGNPPRGNSVNCTHMDADPESRKVQIEVTGLNEAIGIALDLKGGRMFFTDLGGSVYCAKIDGSDKRTLLSGQGALTGIAYADLPITFS